MSEMKIEQLRLQAKGHTKQVIPIPTHQATTMVERCWNSRYRNHMFPAEDRHDWDWQLAASVTSC